MTSAVGAAVVDGSVDTGASPPQAQKAKRTPKTMIKLKNPLIRNVFSSFRFDSLLVHIDSAPNTIQFLVNIIMLLPSLQVIFIKNFYFG